jgi:uncharacterized protein
VILDANANLSRWPFRRTPCDELPVLLARYRKFDVAVAWVGTLDGLFHRDIAGANRRLAEACRDVRDVQLVPFGSVNPRLPDWEEDLRRCVEEYHMPGIRLHPNYHGYKLDDPVFERLLQQAAERNLLVQLAVRMDDIRVQHPLMQIPDVDLQPMAPLLKRLPRLRIVLLNAMATLRGASLNSLLSSGQVWVEISMKEGVGGVADLVRTIPHNRVLFGSHTPLFSLESAVLKMREADLSPEQRAAIERTNAESLLARN